MYKGNQFLKVINVLYESNTDLVEDTVDLSHPTKAHIDYSFVINREQLFSIPKNGE